MTPTAIFVNISGTIFVHFHAVVIYTVVIVGIRDKSSVALRILL